METKHIFVTQRRLRNVEQLPDLIRGVGLDLRIPQVVLGQLEDGTVFILDGHHRCLAYHLAGRTSLAYGEYILCQVDYPKAMFGRLTNQGVVARLLGK